MTEKEQKKRESMKIVFVTRGVKIHKKEVGGCDGRVKMLFNFLSSLLAAALLRWCGSWLDSNIKTLIPNGMRCARGNDLAGPCCRSVVLPRAYMCFTTKLIWAKQRQHNTLSSFLLLLGPDLVSSTLQQHHHFLLRLPSSDSEVVPNCEWFYG